MSYLLPLMILALIFFLSFCCLGTLVLTFNASLGLLPIRETLSLYTADSQQRSACSTLGCGILNPAVGTMCPPLSVPLPSLLIPGMELTTVYLDI